MLLCLSGLVAKMIQATGYWNSVDDGYVQWYNKGRMYSRGAEIKCLQG